MLANPCEWFGLVSFPRTVTKKLETVSQSASLLGKTYPIKSHSIFSKKTILKTCTNTNITVKINNI